MKNQRNKFSAVKYARAISGFIFFILLCAVPVFAQSQWLDQTPLPNWNSRSRTILQTEKMPASELAQCGKFVRQPTLAADRLLTKNGWTLVGAAQIYGRTTIVTWAQGFDGMCRPRSFQTLVFVGDRVAGTLSPAPMDSRTDGALVNVKMTSETTLTAEYARYRASDALCCPSKIEAVAFVIRPDGANFLLVPESKTPAGIIENQASGATLKNTIWRWESAENAQGKTTVDKPENYRIEFKADGKIGLKADCNSGGGSYEANGGDLLSIKQIFTTKMFCGEKSLDASFLRDLQSARTFRIEGNALFVEGTSGTMKFTKAARPN